MMDLKKLKILDLGIKADRSFFLSKLYPIISQWEGEPPKLLESFESKEIEWLLIEEIENSKIVSFLEFVIKTGYKDKPEYDKSNAPLWIRRTTAIHRAVQNKADSEVISKLFLIYDTFDVNYIDETGLTHYHAACKYGLPEIVEKFLVRRQDPNSLDRYSMNRPLHLALANRRIEVARLLLRSGANPHSINGKKSNPLHIICKTRCDDIETANLLFEFSDEKNHLLLVNAQDKFGMTPLHYALFYKHVKLSELLLRKGANPNLASQKGLTALHVICKKCSDDTMLQMLFDICDEKNQLVQLNIKGIFGDTPLHTALINENEKAAELLLRKGANANLTNNDGSTPLHLIVQKKYHQTAEIFFHVNTENNQLVNALDRYGLAPIHYAFELHDTIMANLLVKNGADLNLRDSEGRTPLHIVCKVESVDIGESLARKFFEISDEQCRTVQINAGDNHGLTPLQWAVARFLRETVDLLVDRGADWSCLVNPTDENFKEVFDESTDTSDSELTTKIALNTCDIRKSLEGKECNMELDIDEELVNDDDDPDKEEKEILMKYLENHGCNPSSMDTTDDEYEGFVRFILFLRKLDKQTLWLGYPWDSTSLEILTRYPILGQKPSCL
uniref:Uncharacterized protein n=1 Tax=Trichogramma kaykai TaxID=54128 RepID=A0ABD2WFJ0_9HYME